MKTQSIKLSSIEITGGTQVRAAIDEQLVSHYRDEMIRGEKFPPVIIVSDGATNWLADGFHRYHAARSAEFMDILAEVRSGSRKDAVKVALGANTTHGMRRTNADKRRAVIIGLEEFPDLSSRELANICGCCHTFVEGIRQAATPKQLATVASCESETRKGADGKERKMPAKKNLPATETPEPDEQPTTGGDDGISQPEITMPVQNPNPAPATSRDLLSVIRDHFESLNEFVECNDDLKLLGLIESEADILRRAARGKIQEARKAALGGAK